MHSIIQSEINVNRQSSHHLCICQRHETPLVILVDIAIVLREILPAILPRRAIHTSRSLSMFSILFADNIAATHTSALMYFLQYLHLTVGLMILLFETSI